MRVAISKDKHSRLWAKANNEDDFVLAVKSIAYNALMDVVVAGIDNPTMSKWFDAHCHDTKLNPFILKACHEMYSVLRK